MSGSFSLISGNMTLFLKLFTFRFNQLEVEAVFQDLQVLRMWCEDLVLWHSNLSHYLQHWHPRAEHGFMSQLLHFCSRFLLICLPALQKMA